MSFISVLFALLLEQARPLQRGNSIHAAMRVWVRWCTRNFDAGKPHHGWLAWGFAVGTPAVLVLVVFVLLDVFVGWPLAVLWSALVLYATLGFRQFSFHFTQIRDALANDDPAKAKTLLANWQQLDAQTLPEQEVVGMVIEYSVLAAHRHVFGVLAWFSILAAFGLGPAGAVLYRMAEFAARYWRHQSQRHLQPVSTALQNHAQTAWEWMDWMPARLTAIGFAVVGNFEEAIEGWRGYAGRPDANQDGLVLAATAGAVNIHLSGMAAGLVTGSGLPLGSVSAPELEKRPKPELAHMAVVVGLVWRTVVMWIVLLALLTLARLLG